MTAAPRVLGLRQVATFTNFHRVLNRNRWSSPTAARRLSDLLLEASVADGPVVIGIDESAPENRRSRPAASTGIQSAPVTGTLSRPPLDHRDTARVDPLGPAGLGLALPGGATRGFARKRGHPHKKPTDRARQLLILLARWLPERQLVAIADSSYTAIERLNAVSRHLTMITRLRPDARPFDPPLPRRPGTMSRPRVIDNA